MKEKYQHVVQNVADGSIAEELEIVPGDTLTHINGQAIEDIFDYQYLVNDDYLELSLLKADGEEWLLEIDKDFDEDLGITFESSLMDDYKSCSNKCVFCFIDQLPEGMRETMYFKDDDSRLSFLQGNYITLTNMKDQDLERIIRYKLSPMNISVHTTGPELRQMMLGNRFAGKIMDQLKRLYEAGIEMNGQIVLCKNLNDGAELDRTLSDLSSMMPYMQSVSVVPVGLTRYREGLYELEPFDAFDAKVVLKQIHGWQQHLLDQYGHRFVFAGDEWYIMAEEQLPKEAEYEGYYQLENGVGMMRLLIEEFTEALKRYPGDQRIRHVSIVSGALAHSHTTALCRAFTAKYPNVRITVHCIKNEYFGERITVTGLITGQDIIRQLRDRKLGDVLLLPSNLLRSQEEVLLDDITVTDIEKALQVPVDIIKSDGESLVFKLLGER